MNTSLTIQPRIFRISISAFFFLSGLIFSSWASRIPDIKNNLGLSDAGLGLILFALPAGQLISLPVSAWMSSKYGSRFLLLIASLLCPLTLIFVPIASGSIQLVLALIVFGVFGNMLNIAMNTQAVGLETMYGRSIMASFHGLWSVAGFTGAVLGSFCVSSEISPLLHFSIIFGLTGMIVLLYFKTTLDDVPSQKNEKRIIAKPDSKLIILGLIAFCCMVCEGAMADWSGVYFQNVVESPAKFITIGYIAFTATMAIGRFTGDWLVTKFSIKRILQMSGITITTGLLTAVIFPNIVSATIGFLLVGFGVSSVVPIVYGCAGRTTTMLASSALATVSTIGFLGFLVGPPLIGFIAQVAGLQFSFTIIAVLGLGITLLATKVKAT